MAPSKVPTIDFTVFHNIIDGKQRGGATSCNGINPSTGEQLWDVPVASQQDVDDAVSAAQKAFESWSQTAVDERRELIKKYMDVLSAYAAEIMELLGKENGKPPMTAGWEFQGTIQALRFHSTLEIPEERFEDEEKVVTTRYVPLGVCAAICPWNFPIYLAMSKIAPALLTGNAIIVKPSPFTPYTTLKMVELAQEVFPPGLVQAVAGDDKLGPMLTAHPEIAKISFTGSIPTGKKIMAACASTLKRITLELGGNDAAIVLPDVDIAKTAPAVAMGAFMNTGQVCVATKRIYIHESIYEPFVEAMVAATKSFKVGRNDEEGVVLGPIQNSMQYEKVKGYFEDTKKNGYKFAAGSPEIAPGKGYFIQPAIIDNPPEDSRIVTEEPFGPIVPTQRWSSEEDVIARANATRAGLGASVWSADVAHAEAIGRRLQAGNVFINSFAKPVVQFILSGHKESGIGGEGGSLGLLAYCNAQAVHVFKGIKEGEVAFSAA